MSDLKIRRDILDELEFDPSIDAAAIGVSVENGVATLSGHVKSCAEKMAAEAVTWRVKGVRAIADEIDVRWPEQKSMPTMKSQLAHLISLPGTLRCPTAPLTSRSSADG